MSQQLPAPYPVVTAPGTTPRIPFWRRISPLRLMSPRGRVNRTTYACVVMPVLAFLLAGQAVDVAQYRATPRDPFGPATGWAALLVAWPMLATQLKRLHDVNASGWWILAFLLPGVHFLFVLHGVSWSGFVGENAHGDGPLPGFHL